jgi:hypothetical protein
MADTPAHLPKVLPALTFPKDQPATQLVITPQSKPPLYGTPAYREPDPVPESEFPDSQKWFVRDHLRGVFTLKMILPWNLQHSVIVSLAPFAANPNTVKCLGISESDCVMYEGQPVFALHDGMSALPKSMTLHEQEDGSLAIELGNQLLMPQDSHKSPVFRKDIALLTTKRLQEAAVKFERDQEKLHSIFHRR